MKFVLGFLIGFLVLISLVSGVWVDGSYVLEGDEERVYLRVKI